MHILSLEPDNNPSWISGSEENGLRNYFMINLHKSIGPDWDQTHDPWICSQACYWLCYPLGPFDSLYPGMRPQSLCWWSLMMNSHTLRVHVYDSIYFTGIKGVEITCTYRPLVKSAYQKINFLISQPKHMLWVLKRTVSMRRFFWAPKIYVQTDGLENI